MVRKVEAYIEKHHMIEEGDTIVAGISGGADSVCLFFLLKEYCEKKKARFLVVHMNHGVRKEAQKDADFVEALCKEYGVEFHSFYRDIPTEAKELGIGTEEAGRKARYESFEQIRTPFGEKGKIAVAHNRNDQAETTLFHMLRGSGITGLSGILPVREHIIHPLLCVERKEIEEYLTSNDKSWCIDSTNEENTYTRNKLRNVVFPYVEKEICEQSIRHIANTAEEAAEVRGFLEELAKQAQELVLEKSGDCVRIKIEAFLKQHRVIQKQILLQALSYLVPSRKDFGAVHMKDILSLLEKSSGKQIKLPYGLSAIREFDKIVIGKNKLRAEKNTPHMVTVPGRIRMEEGTEICFSLLSADNCQEIPQKTYTKWFDYDKISSCLVLRSRQAGDYLTIKKDGGRKTIKEYFIEEKVSRMERENKLLLAEGQHILWVIGMRISESYKVTDKTKTILQVTIKHTKEERSQHG